jgi:hypothetical protein
MLYISVCHWLLTEDRFSVSTSICTALIDHLGPSRRGRRLQLLLSRAARVMLPVRTHSTILSRFRGDYRRSMDWWMDLLTTYTHHSELQVITALLLISTLYQSLEHLLSLFPSCCIFFSHSLAAAPDSGDSSASCSQVLSLQPPVQNLTELNYSPNLPVITSRHGPHRKCPVSIVVVQLLHLLRICCLAMGTCLPSRCPETTAVYRVAV